MSKTMAFLNKDNIVVDLFIYDNEQEDTDNLKDIKDYPIDFGDKYSLEDNLWYRNGEQVLTNIDYACKRIQILENYIQNMEQAYIEGVNSI